MIRPEECLTFYIFTLNPAHTSILVVLNNFLPAHPLHAQLPNVESKGL